MKRVEAYKADDGTLFETPIDGAKHDMRTALSNLSRAYFDGSDGALIVAPRETLRKRLAELERALRTARACLSDLDHYDEDPTDPKRIEEAAKDAARARAKEKAEP